MVRRLLPRVAKPIPPALFRVALAVGGKVMSNGGAFDLMLADLSGYVVALIFFHCFDVLKAPPPNEKRRGEI